MNLTLIQSLWTILVMVAFIGIVIWAFSQERLAPVAVLRETSVAFAALISAFLLKEKLTVTRLKGSGITVRSKAFFSVTAGQAEAMMGSRGTPVSLASTIIPFLATNRGPWGPSITVAVFCGPDRAM